MSNEMKLSDIPEAMTLTEVHDEFCRLLQDENTNHHRMGLLYNHVVKKRLAQKAKYKNALDYFSQTIKQVSRSTLLTYSAVAKAFSAEVTGQFGMACLSLLLTYKAVARIEVNSDNPGDTSIDVPDKDGLVTSKPFKECTAEELRLAIQRKRKPESGQPLPPDVLALVEQYHDAVTDRFAEDVPAQVTARDHKGMALITFKDIPLTDLDGLVEILMDSQPTAAAQAKEASKA
jgi:hypothetical protein